ncbi:metal ABC transporter ATP-binding protein [Nitrospirota bacterium]
MSVNDYIVELKDVEFTYGGNHVLENVTFTVKRGDYLGVIGPNGGGKTTLLRILVGLQKPDSGMVKLFGQDIGSLNGRHRIGYVPQRVSQGDFFFPASVQEIIISGRTPGLGLFRRYGAEDKKAVEQAIDIAGLNELRDRPMGELSGGERHHNVNYYCFPCVQGHSLSFEHADPNCTPDGEQEPQWLTGFWNGR